MDLSPTEKLQKEISIARRELKNIRQEVIKLGSIFRFECEAIKKLLSRDVEEKEEVVKDKNDNSFNMVPIGIVSSCFKSKNGIPRQPYLCQSAKATLEINKTYFSNPNHSVVGLNEFSHIWVLFVFNKNSEYSRGRSKVHPPRLNGISAGVFSTRSPHRPCPVGLSLVKLDKITGSTLFLSGVDMLDGTPVLDIKPYLPSYDTPKFYQDVGYINSEISFSVPNEIDPKDSATSDNCIEYSNTYNAMCLMPGHVPDICNEDESIKKLQILDNPQKNSITPSIGELLKMPPTHLEVVFTTRAEKNIEKFHSQNHDFKCSYCLDFIAGPSEAKQAVIEILQNDPRSVYRRNKCSDKLYFFTVDSLHITCWFDDLVAEVLRIKPTCDSQTL